MLLDQGLVRNQEAWGLAFKLRPGRSFFSAFPLPAGTWRLKAFPAGQPEGQAQGPRARASPGAPHPSQQGRSERLWLGPARIISCLQAAQWPQASPPAGPAATGLCAVPISQPSPRSWPPSPSLPGPGGECGQVSEKVGDSSWSRVGSRPQFSGSFTWTWVWEATHAKVQQGSQIPVSSHYRLWGWNIHPAGTPCFPRPFMLWPTRKLHEAGTGGSPWPSPRPAGTTPVDMWQVSSKAPSGPQ